MHSSHFASSPGARCLLFVMMDVEDDKDENMLGNDDNILGEEHNGDWYFVIAGDKDWVVLIRTNRQTTNHNLFVSGSRFVFLRNWRRKTILPLP